MIEASRGVTCGIVSSPTFSSIATAAMRAESRARAIGLSFRSVASTRPDALRRSAAASRASVFVPFGGSSSTETTHSPASSLRWSSVFSLRRATETGDLALDGCEAHARLALLLDGCAIAAICAGVVPQQPPMIRAPRFRACAANSAK